ncbi:hypothetical protein DW940_04245 [Bacteroides uniformis]|nr:hypothetical protein DXB64_16465 [Bacteroides uniformis]RGN44321.1 hypothetical protein DXB62_15425 [Bacteroides uniformis]RHA35237.1 hypothetical protein DW940_04245 [Bacteroides uniformis]RHD37744.1 hypothetical protein DW795_16120 [Bacteroides uniformis]
MVFPDFHKLFFCQRLFRMWFCGWEIYTEPYSVVYLDTLSRILRVPQSYSEIPPLQKVFWEGDGLWRLDGLKQMLWGVEMLLQNEMKN